MGIYLFFCRSKHIALKPAYMMRMFGYTPMLIEGLFLVQDRNFSDD